MNGQHACCQLQLCCRKRSDAAIALAENIAHDFGWSAHKDEVSTGNARAVADWIFERFDLVPKGVGAAIAEAYQPFLKEMKGPF